MIPPGALNQIPPPVDPKLVPFGVFITSPNMDYVPDFTCKPREVWICRDGRYFVHDFTLYPQWYFQGTYYLPFILRKPCAEILKDHEYAAAWYNIQPQDFCKEGAGGVEVGRLRKDLVACFLSMWKALSKKVDEFVGQASCEEILLREIRHSQQGMQFASIALDCAPQNFLMTLLTVTSFQ